MNNAEVRLDSVFNTYMCIWTLLKSIMIQCLIFVHVYMDIAEVHLDSVFNT